jgi:hypothetical protein
MHYTQATRRARRRYWRNVWRNIAPSVGVALLTLTVAIGYLTLMAGMPH